MTVTSISADHWTTSERVHAKLEVQKRGQDPGVDQEIADATDSIQAEALQRGLYDAEGDLPASEADLTDLLIQATTYYAIYEGYGTLASQLQRSGGDDAGGSQFKDKAMDKLEQAEARMRAGTDSSTDDETRKSVTTTARSDSLMEW